MMYSDMMVAMGEDIDKNLVAVRESRCIHFRRQILPDAVCP